MVPTSERLVRLREQGGCFPVAGRSVLRVSGADRVRYLNGQTSNDMRRLSASQAISALVLTAKGKLCAVVSAWSDDTAIILETETENAEALLARLERYAISDDVIFEQIENPPSTWHVFGPAAEGVSGRQVQRLGLPGVDVDVHPDHLPEATPDEVEFLRVQHGVAKWGAEIDENTLPQEAELERFAVDFNKGCYVGQEIVSRLKSVGRVNRRLRGFVGDFVPPGSQLVNSAGKSVGRITSSTPNSDRGIALGYLSSSEEERDFSVQNESGACLGRVERCEFPLVSA